MARTAILLGIGEPAVLDEAGGIAGHDGPGGDIAGNKGTGADNTPLVDGHAGEHRGAGRDPAGRTNRNRLRHQRKTRTRNVVRAGQQPDGVADAGIVADRDLVERIDPALIAD